MFQVLMREGVIVRPVQGFPTSVRITIGTHEENVRLVDTLKRVCPLAGVSA
jgi:histidinol-phosphate/aromatic aminotransferase/cobyric acid decarboxylase-like protein